MKAKTVAKFERGLDPKRAMGTGETYENRVFNIQVKFDVLLDEAYSAGIKLSDIEDLIHTSIHEHTKYSDEAYDRDLNLK